jgi:hypothetical protein
MGEELERRPPLGGGESVLAVSGTWSWYGAKSMLRLKVN